MTVDLKRQVLPDQGFDHSHRLWVGKSVFINMLPTLRVPDGSAVGQNGVIHASQLFYRIPQNAPGPAAGQGQLDPLLPGRPKGGNIPGRDSGMVVIQQGAVHIHDNKFDSQ